MTGRLVLLAALLALLALVVSLGREEAEAPVAAGAAQPPVYYLRSAQVTEYDDAGAVRYEPAAAGATEEPASGAVRLEDVAIDYRAAAGQDWRVTAARGRILPGAAVVDLEGDVRMTGLRAGVEHPAVLRTARLALDTQARIASTTAEVLLDYGRHSLRATGLRADLKAETLRLESSVNGRFAP